MRTDLGGAITRQRRRVASPGGIGHRPGTTRTGHAPRVSRLGAPGSRLATASRDCGGGCIRQHRSYVH